MAKKLTKQIRERFEQYQNERPSIRQGGNTKLDKMLDDAFCAIGVLCDIIDAECKWTEVDDSNDCYWDTECGKAFTVFEGKPSDHGMKYCCYCSKEIVEIPVSPVFICEYCGVVFGCITELDDHQKECNEEIMS